jgi:Zn-finger protein
MSGISPPSSAADMPVAASSSLPSHPININIHIGMHDDLSQPISATPSDITAKENCVAMPVRSRSGHTHHESHASLTEALSGLSYRADTPAVSEMDAVMEVPAPPIVTVTHNAIDLTDSPPPLVSAVSPPVPPPAVADIASVADGPVTVVTEGGETLYEAERIVAKRRNNAASASGSSSASGRGISSDPRIDPDQWLYKVKWRGFSDRDSTWEAYVNIATCTDLLEQFFVTDAAATLAKKQQRLEKKNASAAAASFAAEAYAVPAATAATPAAPARNSSTGRVSLGSKLSAFPTGALDCCVCGQSSAGTSADSFVFCKVCFQPSHRTCSERSGITHAGVWSCSACAVANSMVDQTVDSLVTSEPVSRTEQLRSVLLAVQTQITRDNWHSVPLAAHGGSALDWQSLSSAFQSCCSQMAAHAALSELVAVDTYEHLLTHLLIPALDVGTSLRLVTGEGVQPSSSQRESMIKAVSACSLTLQLLSIPNVPRRLIQEEHVRSVTLFLLHSVREVIMPLWDHDSRERILAQLSGVSVPTKKKQKNKGKNVKEESGAMNAESDDDEVEELTHTSGPDQSYWHTLQGHMRYLVNRSAALMHMLTRFQSMEKYPELLASKVQDACFHVLSLTPVSGSSDVSVMQSLQSSCSLWLQKHFLLSDASIRQSILDSIAHTYRTLSPARRNLRTYVVHVGTQRAGVKKEETKAGAIAIGTDNSAINSSIPLPNTNLHQRDQPQICVQPLTALVCELMQSLSTQPLLAQADSSTTLLERIQREVRAKDMLGQAQAASDVEGATATTTSKKGKGKKRRNSKGGNADADVEMKSSDNGDAVTLSSSFDTPFSALHSALDTPSVRNEFIATLTAPVQTEKQYTRFFLSKLFEYVQPPPKDAPSSSSAISRKTSKLILRNFMEDLLQLLFAPEFPSAEVLLPRFVQMLIMCVDGKEGGFSDGLRLVAMPLVGLFAIHIKLHSFMASEHPILFRPHRKLEEDGTQDGTPASMQGGEVLDCICGIHKTANTQQELEGDSTDNFLLDCDDCHVWFHGGQLSITKIPC